MLSLLIPGPSTLKSSIDVYLEPLIDELKELWEKGFETYNASSKEFFQAHVALLWTINDFLAYAMLSGWTTSGKLASLVYNYHICLRYLNNSKKMCYMCHRRWLDSKYRWREDSKCFDGTQESRGAPTPLKSSFFKMLCSKVIIVDDFESLDVEIASILCELERICPPSFFVIMVHLSIHLAYEARIVGLVHYRWMYPIER